MSAIIPAPSPSPGLVIAGKRVPVPGVEVVTWLDDRSIPRTTDGRPRSKPPVGLVLHTVHGHLGPLRETSGPSTRAEIYARYQARTGRDVSWHLTVDTDGTVVQSADLSTWWCWHAGEVNAWTIGLELVQDNDGSLYKNQMQTLVKLTNVICDSLLIPRRVPVDAKGAPVVGVIPRLEGAAHPWEGIFGHRHQTRHKGPGDPGDHPFLALLGAGYQGVRL